jgi:hypothetical protein
MGGAAGAWDAGNSHFGARDAIAGREQGVEE